jgi:nicotinamide mononucleotide (NMN) deamidase PncC
VDFTFSLPDDTPRDRARLLELKQKIIEHLGDYIYADSDTSLEEHVVKLLEARKATLAIAEAGSGGSLTAALNSAEGARQVLAGAYAAPTVEKLRRLLGVPDDRWTGSTSRSQKVEQLAEAAADATASQWAVAVGNAWQDVSGAGYVDVAFRLPPRLPPEGVLRTAEDKSGGRVESQQVRLRDAGELGRLRLSTELLDHLRRRLRSGP